MNEERILKAQTGEKMQFQAHNFNDVTIRFILHYPAVLNKEVLRKAALTLAGSVDVLHASFVSGKVSAHWYVNDTFEEKDYFSYEKTTASVMDAAAVASLHSVEPEGKVKLHCALINGKEESAVVLNISHLCVDGGDGKYLLKKLIEAYNLIMETGKTDGFYVKNGRRDPEQLYDHLSKQEYRSLIKNPLTGVKSGFPFQDGESGKRCLVCKKISKEILHMAGQRAKKENATVNDLFLTAFYRAYAKLPEVNAASPMSIMSFLDLRRHCEDGDSPGLSNMSGSLPTILENGVKGEFYDTLCEVSEETRKIKSDPLAGMEGMPVLHGVIRKLPTGLLLKAAEIAYGHMSLGLTNLGNINGEELAIAGIVPDEIIFGGPLKKKPAFQLSAMSIDGRGTICSVGEYNENDIKIIQRLLDQMMDEISQYGNEADRE